MLVVGSGGCVGAMEEELLPPNKNRIVEPSSNVTIPAFGDGARPPPETVTKRGPLELDASV